MEILEQQNDEAVVRLGRAELLILNNALNEVCHGLDVPEFHSRIGAEEADVLTLLRAINGLLE